jgi:hypothetical protein
MAANHIYVLGLETSCDETAAAIVEVPVENGAPSGGRSDFGQSDFKPD